MSNTLSLPTKSPIIAYAVPNEAESFMRMDEIDDTLNSIFTPPKELSAKAQQELNYILCEIDKIYMKNSKDEVGSIYNQMALATGDSEELALLEEELSQLFIKNENVNIAMDDEVLLEKLNKQADALYETQESNETELSYADALFCEKNALFTAVLNG